MGEAGTAVEREVLILEDDALAVRTLRRVLSRAAHVTVVPTAAEATCAIDAQTWNGLFFNAMLPCGAGLDALAHARRRGCECPAVIYSPVYVTGWLARARHVGAVPLDVLDDGIIRGFADDVLARMRGPSTLDTRITECGLTPTETRLIALVVRGLTHKEISTAMTITANTLKRHISNILHKTGAPSVRAAALQLVVSETVPESGSRPMVAFTRESTTRLRKAT